MKNKYFIILAIGFILWIVETAVFGFNKTPQSGLEGLLDMASMIMMIYGFIGDITTNLRVHKHYHNVSSTNIRTKNVELCGNGQKIKYNQNVTIAGASKTQK